MQMVTLIVEKRPMCWKLKMENKVREALMASKSGVTALLQALPSQVSMKGATAQQISATLTAANVGKLYDGLIDMVMGLFSAHRKCQISMPFLGWPEVKEPRSQGRHWRLSKGVSWAQLEVLGA